MKIAIDISPLSSGHRVRGVGSYVALIKDNIEKYDTKNKYIFFEGRVPDGVDIVHFPYFDPFFPILPFKNKVKTVVTVHDLTPIKFKKHFPSGIKGSLKWQYNKLLLKKADLIIVDSKASKKDVIDIIHVSEDKVKVVYLASNSVYKKINVSPSRARLVMEKYNIPKNFVLYVGDVTWNKNLPRIIKAAIKLDIDLVLVGKALKEENFDRNNPWNKDRIEIANLIKSSKKIKVLGFVPEDDLLTIYNIAQVLLMPSLYEGFGLPVLEAMSCGCPVITSKEGSLPEVGGDAVFYVDAKSEDSIADGISKILENKSLREELSAKGLAQAGKFAKNEVMPELVKAYESIK